MDDVDDDVRCGSVFLNGGALDTVGALAGGTPPTDADTAS